MTRLLIPVLLFVAGIVHLLPLIGVIGPAALGRLYAVPVADPNLEILLRHRAVMLGVLGALLTIAAFVPALRLVAAITSLASAAAFVGIAWLVGDYNAAVGRVVRVDAATTVVLSIALVAIYLTRTAGRSPH